MKKFNKKGFTIVELVIVIAVIAILAGVLIPTFSGIVTKAQESKVLQIARNAYAEIYAADIEDGVIDATSKDGNEGDLKNGGSYLPSGATSIEYKTDEGKVVSFALEMNDYTATYAAVNGNFEWKVEQAN